MPFQAVADQKLLQLLGQEINWLKMGRMPALILVDRTGRILYEHHGQSMRDLPDFHAVIRTVKASSAP